MSAPLPRVCIFLKTSRPSFENNFLLLSCQEVISYPCVNLCWHMLIQPCCELSTSKLQWQQIHKLYNLLRVTSVLRCISTAVANPGPANSHAHRQPAEALPKWRGGSKDRAWALVLLEYGHFYSVRIKIWWELSSLELNSAVMSYRKRIKRLTVNFGSVQYVI